MRARSVWWLIGGGILGALAVGGYIGSCDRRDEAGQRADSVLASDTIYRQRIREQDATIAELEDSIRVTDRERVRWRDSARALTREADTDQAEIDRAVAAGVPPGTDPAMFWRNQFQAQARVATTLRLQVIPALEAVIMADSLGMQQRDEKAAEAIAQRDFARARVKEITREFQDYREASRPGIDLGFMRVPDWAAEVALAVIAGYAGCKAGGGC